MQGYRGEGRYILSGVHPEFLIELGDLNGDTRFSGFGTLHPSALSTLKTLNEDPTTPQRVLRYLLGSLGLSLGE